MINASLVAKNSTGTLAIFEITHDDLPDGVKEPENRFHFVEVDISRNQIMSWGRDNPQSGGRFYAQYTPHGIRYVSIPRTKDQVIDIARGAAFTDAQLSKLLPVEPVNPVIAVQTVVYICGEIDRAILGSETRSYELCSGCAGGQIETTTWIQETAAPALLAMAAEMECDCVGTTEWFYEVCESFGRRIYLDAIGGEWPDDSRLSELAKEAINEIM